MLKLVITDDEGRTTVVPLDRDEVTIGRGEGNTIRLTERNVSRKHAVLRRSGRGHMIEDLKSYNGTKLGGVKITSPQVVRDGERIQVGDYQVTIQSARQPVRVARDGTKTTQITADADTALFAMPDERPPTPKAAPRPLGKPRFIVEAGPVRGRQFVLDKDEATIGQAPECEVRLDHPSVSRAHAKLVNVGSVRILDLNSTNGVRVNGREVPYAELEPGDLVELGEVKLRFVIPGLASRAGARGPSRRATVLAAGLFAGFGVVAAVLFLAWPAPTNDPLLPDTPAAGTTTATPGNTGSPAARATDPNPEITRLINAARDHEDALALPEAFQAATQAKALQEANHQSTASTDRLLQDLERDRRSLEELDRARNLASTNPAEALAALDRIAREGPVARDAGVSLTAADALRTMLNEARSLARRAAKRDDARQRVTTILAHPRLGPTKLTTELERVRAEARAVQELLADRPVATGPRPGGPHPHGDGHEKVVDTPRPQPSADETARYRQVVAASSNPTRYKQLACSFVHDFPRSPRASQVRQICNR